MPDSENADQTPDASAAELPTPSRFRESWLFTKSLVKSMCNEGWDRSSPDWPPTWLKVSVAIAVATLLGFTVIEAVAIVAVRVGSNLFDIVTSTKWADTILVPVRQFLREGAVALPLDPAQLYSAWALLGLLFLVAARAGRLGLLCWSIFGATTVGMVWSSTPSPSQWVAAGLTSITWAALSLAVQIRSSRSDTDDESGRRPKRSGGSQRTAELRGAATQRRVDTRVRLLGYSDTASYFASDERRSIKQIADDLHIKSAQAKVWRTLYLGDAKNVSRSPSLGIKNNIAREYLSGGVTYRELASKHGFSESSIRRWARDYSASQATPVKQHESANGSTAVGGE